MAEEAQELTVINTGQPTVVLIEPAETTETAAEIRTADPAVTLTVDITPAEQMGQFVFNVAKGRTREYHERVDGNDPANSALILVVLAEASLESDAVLKDYDTLAAVLAGASDEVTNGSYARKTLTDANLTAASVDDTNDWALLPFPTQTWATIAAGDSWRKLLVCYDSDTTGGTDTNVVPVTAHDLLIYGAAIVPSGANIVVSGSNGYARAR